MQKEQMTLNQAYDHVKRCKPNISPNFNFMGQLLDFEKALSGNDTQGHPGFFCQRSNPLDSDTSVRQTWRAATVDLKNVYFTHKRWDISFFISQTKKTLSSPQQREKTAAQALDASTCSWWNANSCFNELEHIGLRLSAKLMISKKSDSVLERLQWQKMNSKTSRLQGCRFPTRAQRQKDQLFFPHSISVTKYFCERHTTGLT